MNRYRKFDGKRYEIWDFLPRSKGEANRKARGARERGLSARVVKRGVSYFIYLRAGR